MAAPPAQVALNLRARLPDFDLTLLTEEVISVQQAMAPGIKGAWDDCVAQLSPWGFDVAQISIPVLLLHGGQDRAVPFSHGQWLASHIPNVEAWSFEEEGHGLGESHIEDVHAWLIDHNS